MNVHRTETRQQREARMQWWRESRFGMFVHWSLYSSLAGTWKGKPVGNQGGMEWIQQRISADTWEYAHEAIPLFRPKEGFARKWAKLARQAGCRYVIFTSKYHDGLDSTRTIGRWMAANGQAIYGTMASPFERSQWGRFTKKAGKLYAHVFQWPKDGTLEVPVGSLNVTRAYLRADTDKTSLKTEKRPDALLIHVPQQAPDEIVSVVAIEHRG